MTRHTQFDETPFANYMLPKDVRFKNQGLDSIEVQDNGSGISPGNYESLALKHYTSKLSTYSDLGTLETFGFRGEALSSLCALSRFTVITCIQSDVPKGTRLEFETSGKLKGTSVVATQKGTIVSVENLFQNLPVRRRELERNIKREWGKVISLLNQYACVQTGVKFTVSQQPNKGKRIVLFSTKGNKSTRENIINVFGAKTMAALVALDLKLELESTSGTGQRWSTQEDGGTKEVLIKGYVSRPVHGEGRQTPDRQMFYVNSRPCGLPQFAKVFNEVYRSFNSSQSPFIFADIQLDTHLYDVNVSPDKRTILLHDQSRMLDNLRDVLTELFEKQDFTVPMTQITPFKQPTLKRLAITHRDPEETSPDSTAPEKSPVPARESEEPSETSEDDMDASGLKRMKNLAAAKALARDAQASDLKTRWVERHGDSREEPKSAASNVADHTAERALSDETDLLTVTDQTGLSAPVNGASDRTEVTEDSNLPVEAGQGEGDLFSRLAQLKRSFLPESLQGEMSDSGEPPIPAIAKPTKPTENAPLSVSTTRSLKRPSQEVATITIGEQTVTSIIGTPPKRARRDETAAEQKHSRKESKTSEPAAPLPSFRGRLTQMFAAAAAEQPLSTDDEPLQVETMESDEESRDHEDGRSEASDEIIDDEDEEDEASDKSSPLFVEQDEDDDHSSAPLQDEGDEALDEEEDKSDLDEGEAETREDLVIQDTIAAVEEADHSPSEENRNRTQVFLKGGRKGKYTTQVLLQRLKINEESLQRRLESWEVHLRNLPRTGESNAPDELDGGLEAENAEEKLSLTIHKGDFGKMKIVGQFNLGFILAVRPRGSSIDSSSSPAATSQNQEDDDDDLIIVDQHASDEKFNFERLQSTTVVQSQRLVRPKLLELTAVEEEIVIENQAALEKNGFVVSVDTSGDEPVGSRCQLLSLPLSRETTFSLADLEELISLLGDNPTTTAAASEKDGEGMGGVGESLRYIPRPSKVRKMFAMRACRSSIMIGRALSHQQMERVVRHMGEMERPWNCPHGRPTMRHLCGLGGAWDERCWREGDAADCGDYFDSSARDATGGRTTDWAGYVKQMREGL